MPVGKGKAPPARARRLIGSVLAVTIACGSCDMITLEKHRLTMQRLELIAAQLQAIQERTGAYPISEETDSLPWIAKGVDAEFLVDGWERPVKYLSDGESYVLWSEGRDGKRDGATKAGAQSGFDTDIVVVNGLFWRCISSFAPGVMSDYEDPFSRIGHRP